MVITITTAILYNFIPTYAEGLSPAAFIEEIDVRVPEDKNIYQYRSRYFVITYYNKRIIPYIKTLDSISDNEYYLLIFEKYMSEVMSMNKDIQVVTQGGLFTANGRGSVSLVKVNQ